MLKEALEYLVGLGKVRTLEINGETYSTVPMHYVKPFEYMPETLTVNGLDSIVKLIRSEMDRFNAVAGSGKMLIQVVSAKEVRVYTNLDYMYRRMYPYRALLDAKGFCPGWRELDSAVMDLKCGCMKDENRDYVLRLISSLSSTESNSVEDNGVTQVVTVRKGIAMKGTEEIRELVELTPYRTFREVAQPRSQFVIRVKDGKVGILEADAGVWELQAKLRIKEYFEDHMKEFIDLGTVVVMM